MIETLGTFYKSWSREKKPEPVKHGPAPQHGLRMSLILERL